MRKKCLMIETKDRRRFFTHPNNYEHLIEFGKTFGAELSVVKVEEPEILDLMSLAPALCDSSFKISKNQIIEIIETKLPKDKKKRRSLLQQASEIKGWIKRQFLTGKAVRLKDIKEHYKNYNLTSQAFCNHLADVRKNLESEGFEVRKIGHGSYILNQSDFCTSSPSR